MSIVISAIICTHNRADYLSKAINSLINQTLPKEKYEIIVVDNSSKDNTKEVVDEFKESNLRYVFEENLGLSHSRNTGFKEARGEYIAYLDDDAVASQEWLENIIESFQNIQPQPGCVGGKVEPVWQEDRPTWLDDNLLKFLSVVDWGDDSFFLDNEDKWLAGANLAYPKKILREVGGFNAQLGRKGKSLLSMEENFIRREIEKREFKYFYNPKASVKHYIIPSRLKKEWFFKRSYYNGASQGLMKLYEGAKRMPMVLSGIKLLLDLIRQENPLSESDEVFAKCRRANARGYLAAAMGLIR